MRNFKLLAEIVRGLDKKAIWAYMLEIAAVIDGRGDLSAEQKQEAYDLATTEFENSEDGTIGANVFAEAAIKTILDDEYDEEDMDAAHDLFNQKYDNLIG